MGYSLGKGRPRQAVHTGPGNELEVLGQGIPGVIRYLDAGPEQEA